METMEFDPMRYLQNDEERIAYLEDMMAEGNSNEIQKAIADVCRAMKADVCESYLQLMEENIADFGILVGALDAIGLKFSVKKK